MKITCKEASRLISAGLDRKLSLGDRTALRLISPCAMRAASSSAIRVLRRALSTYATRAEAGRHEDRRR